MEVTFFVSIRYTTIYRVPVTMAIDENHSISDAGVSAEDIVWATPETELKPIEYTNKELVCTEYYEPNGRVIYI